MGWSELLFWSVPIFLSLYFFYTSQRQNIGRSRRFRDSRLKFTPSKNRFGEFTYLSDEDNRLGLDIME